LHDFVFINEGSTMNVRLVLLDLAATHRLDATAQVRLLRLAGLDEQPRRLNYWLKTGLALLAAGLGGLGIIFWIAANWDSIGRTAHFVLLQGFVLAMCLGAAAVPAARTALGLIALLAIGALFAYFGQTYQTGADPWQLFALWTALALPLCAGTRSDVIWSAWVIIAAVAISRWDFAHAGYGWRADTNNTIVHLVAWAAALLLALLLSPLARRFTRAGTWAYRTALSTLALLVTFIAVFGLWTTPCYWLGLLLLGVLAWALTTPRMYDIFGLSTVALGVNILVVAGLGYALLEGVRHEPIGQLLILGLAAAGLLAGTVRLILRVSRQYDTEGDGA